MNPTEQPIVPVAGARYRGIVWCSLGLASVLLVGLYAAVGFLWLPRFIAKDLPTWLTQRYGLHLTLGSLDFNPFHFDLEAKNLVLRAADGAPLLRVENLSVNYAPLGLLHRTFAFDHITVSGLHVDLVLAKDGTLNIVELLKRLAPPVSEHSAGLGRLVVDRLAVQGSVRFSDLRGLTPATTSISPISFSMSGLSTVSKLKATQTLSATLPDGTTLREHGDLVLEPVFSAEGQFALQGVQAKNWLPFIQNDLRIKRLEGSAALSANYRYATAGGLQLEDAALHVADLLLEASGLPMPLIAMKKIDATGGKLDLTLQSASFSRLVLAQGQTSLSIATDGRVGWTELLPVASVAPPVAPASNATGTDWHIGVAALQLDRVGFAYEDRQRQPPLAAKVGSVDGKFLLGITTGLPTELSTQNVALTAHDIALPAPAIGGPALKIDSVTLQEGSFDLATRRIAAKEVSINGGKLSAGRNADGSIDWARRFALAPGSNAPSAGTDDRWHYDIAKASINGVSIALKDRSVTPTFDYDVRVESATAQHLTNVGTEPMGFETIVSARQGGILHTKGSFTQNGTDLEASIRLDNFAITPFETLAKHYTGFDVTGDPLTLAAKLHNARGLVVDGLDLALTNFAVRRQPKTEPLLFAAHVQAHSGQVDLAKRRVAIGQLTLANGAVNALMQPDGKLDWEAAASQSVPARPHGVVTSEPWNVSIQALTISQMAAHYADSRRATPLRLNIDRVDLGMALQLSAGGASTQVIAKDVQAQVHATALSIDEHKPPTLVLASATLSGGTFDLATRRLTADKLVLTGGDTRIARSAEGRVVALDSFVIGPSSASAPSVLVKKDSPWEYAVKNLQVQNFGIEAEDQSFAPPLALTGHVDATVRQLASSGTATFDATLSLAKSGGNVQATGTVTPASGNVRANVVAKSLALMPLQPLISRHTTLALQSGSAGGDLKVQYENGGLLASGQLHVDKLALDETVQGTHFLALEQLDAQQIDFNSGDRRLSIGEINLLAPDARIAIAKDHSVNLTDVIRHGSTESGQKTATHLDAPASAPGFDIGVRRVRIHGGTVDFSDQSLVLPFATKVTAIDATIAGISNDEARRADVQARGSIQAYGSASVDGSIAPFDPRRYTDLRVEFNNVMVQPFSPYSATFAGRKVQSGKLWLDLEYKIDHGNLLGKNDVRLADFSLGERVESPTASTLPLNLAVSLLTDSKGEIHLSVPVRGNVDNPHFEIGSAVAQAFKNTLGRIVTAPFRLLGRLFGGHGGSLDNSIDFVPGSAALAPDQREKLDALIHALQERPLLHLVVSAPYADNADTLALQQTEARRELAARLNQPATNDEASSLIVFDDPATRTALRSMLTKEGGRDTAAVATLPASGSGDRAAYEALFNRIAKQQQLNSGATRILAARRAARIAQFLTENGIERGRVQTGQVESVSVTDAGTVDARLQISTGLQ